MKKEDKQLLLVDLCARLPYGVKVQIPVMNDVITLTCGDISAYFFNPDNKLCLKPYLRLMSSMTEEEKVQLSQYACIGEDLNGEFIDEVQRKDCAAYIDWLNVHHFDYNGLIEKGLAIKVTEDNNPYEN